MAVEKGETPEYVGLAVVHLAKGIHIKSTDVFIAPANCFIIIAYTILETSPFVFQIDV